MSRSERTKGASGERELCAVLSAELGRVVKRNLGQARDSGHDVDVGPFRIECKRRKRIAGLYKWIDQAEAPSIVAHDGDTVPVVALRADGKDWLVTMRLRDWCALARESME